MLVMVSNSPSSCEVVLDGIVRRKSEILDGIYTVYIKREEGGTSTYYPVHLISGICDYFLKNSRKK